MRRTWSTPSRWWAICIAFLLAAFVAPAAATDLPYSETFDGADGTPWPSPWFDGGAHVTTWDLHGGTARLIGDPGFVSRMILPGFAETDVEMEATVEFANVAFQGIGFYVRQNGGTLQEYLPHGQGYAMFLKGTWAWPDDLGLWREIDGVETQFFNGYNPIGAGLVNGTRYRLRFRATQDNAATTRLQARVWREADEEPVAWTVETTDAQPQLQGQAGSFAIDIYNHNGTQPIYVDDLLIRRYPYPVGVPERSPEARLTLGAVRPNPVRDELAFELTLATGGDVDVALHDLAGRAVWRHAAGVLAAGVHPLRFDRAAARLTPGVYLMTARAGGTRVSRRIVVHR